MNDELNIACDYQQTAEWFDARLGFLTASRIADALAKRKKGDGELETRYRYKLELAVERITGKPTEHYVSKAMETGIEREPLARAAYELRTELNVVQTGFVFHPSIEWSGCSPDGLIGKTGLVEFKCPSRHTHAEYLLGELVPLEYIPQMMWQMACCNRQWNVFVSYCPDFPEPLDLFVVRVDRDEKLISEMEAEAQKFLAEVDALTIRLKNGLEGALEHEIRRSKGQLAVDAKESA